MLSQHGHSSTCQGAAGLRRLQCAAFAGAHALTPLAGGLRRRSAGQRIDKMAELSPVGLGLGFMLPIERFLKSEMLAKVG